MNDWGMLTLIGLMVVNAFVVVIGISKKMLANNNAAHAREIRRMQHKYVSQMMAHALHVNSFDLLLVAPESVQDLQPGCACWVATTVAYMRPEDAGSNVRWLSADELNEHGTRAEWQMCDMLLCRSPQGKYTVLQFGGGPGLLTQRSGAFLPKPSPETHTLEVIDLGSAPDAPLRVQL